MSKYDFLYNPKNFRRVDESTMTVPDLVLSMAEIYRKYALTGDINALPGKVRPQSFDTGDEFDESFESEEMTDSMLHATNLRRSSVQDPEDPAPANPAEEDKPVGEAVVKEPQAPAKQENPDVDPVSPSGTE